uniref:ShKT domain-containing protein n=1 Tax=Strongyloides stercoralis TaxID=6248 RepID=A0A0K0E3V7_STRER
MILITVIYLIFISKLFYCYVTDNETLLYSPSKKIFTVDTVPCCGDMIGETACKRLRKKNEFKFQNKCENEADFSLVQCCQTCGGDTAPLRHKKLFNEGSLSKHCFDRHSPKFCEKFLLHKDHWATSTWSCSGEYAHIAFRICRKTCSFCRRDAYDNKDGSVYKAKRCGALTPTKIRYFDDENNLEELEKEFDTIF